MRIDQGYLYLRGGFIGEVKNYDTDLRRGRFTIYGLEELEGVGVLPDGWRIVQKDDLLHNQLWNSMIQEVHFNNWKSIGKQHLWNHYITDRFKGEDFDMYCRRVYEESGKVGLQRHLREDI